MAVTAAIRSTHLEDLEWLTINQACQLVGRSRRTIYHWINKGLLTTRREAGGGQQILAASLFREPDAPLPVVGSVEADRAAAADATDELELDTE